MFSILAKNRGCPQNFGDDGIPLVLSVQVKASSLSPFRVISKNGVHSTQTVQLWSPPQTGIAHHSSSWSHCDPNDLPDRVEIIGAVEDVNGNSLTGLVSPTVIVGSSTGPALINAYLFNQVLWDLLLSTPTRLEVVWGPRGGILVKPN